nr:hypothetical protein CFP56_50530 [Quercus suber]
MTPELGWSIGSSIGKVVRVAEFEEKGTIGRSLWVRVAIDVSKSLSRGRKLWDNGKTPLEQRQFGPWLRAETDYHFRKPWSSRVGSEREEASQARQSMSPPVQGSPSSRLSGIGDDAPRATTTQPDKVTRVGEPESSLHEKPLLEDSKRFDETLLWIDRELGLLVDYVALPLVNPLEVVLNAKSNPTKKLPADKISVSAISEINPLNFGSGLNKENGPNPMAASSTGNMRPPLVDISNNSGLKGKSQAKNKGTPQDKTPVVEGSERSNSDAFQPVEEAHGPCSGMSSLSL